ncbi:helix-turn-helix transcriptional regulator [Paludisphaera mucosa]|uniref:Helix-turn-helix domain-containing protein n=1 Tax=Paludisphaera mucosa TaxID=3030827 RepID=A0ABT6FES9_9BACT|nr:helix-turn-helix domain-containing protein [Paludisphaera mucosa]MDG3006082.1 helix-turn-helix domain-containing protein [Paludisphaera mucosa]
MNSTPRPDAAPAFLEPLLSIEDLAAALSCSRRLVERMRAAGKLPRPDLHVGRMPRWRRSTFVQWIAQGGR